MIKPCDHCGKEFVTYPSTIAQGRGKYCSRACSDFCLPKVKRNCDICRKEFEVADTPSRNGRGRHCSRICFHKWRKGQPAWNKGKPALWSVGNTHRLGKPNLSPNRMFGKANPKWISDRTKLKGTFSVERRSSAYVTWRKEVWKRDGYKCKMADEQCFGRLEAHHLVSFTKFPLLRHEIKNGISLCHFHHPRKRKDELRMVEIFRKLIDTDKL